jgi:taurine dioxygenase
MIEQGTIDKAPADSGDAIAVIPSGDALGAEVTGLDVAGGIDEAALIKLRDAVLRHALVVLRNQRVTPAEQLAFTNRIETVRPAPRPAAGSHAPVLPDFPELVVVSNIVEDGRKIGISDAGLLWHSDTCFQSNPELFVTLYALEIPIGEDGVALGDTRYVSTTAAYDALDEATKVRLEGLQVVQSYVWHTDKLERLGLLTRPKLTEEQRRDTVELAHPLVRTHPVTGRKLLYINEAFSARITGWSEADSRALLDPLLEHIKREEFMTKHRWREGDLLIWDNAATQHLATFDYGTMRRRLHRCGTVGPVPA